MTAEKDWTGKLIFDTARHKTIMHLPIDWPRINQFPEWFTVRSESSYTFHNLETGERQSYNGKRLREGIHMMAKAGTLNRIRISLDDKE